MVLIAHLSDPHLDGSPVRDERLRRAVALVASVGDRLDAVIVSGDIAHDGTPQQYRRARELPAGVGRVPVLWCPGNRDQRGPFRMDLLGEATGSDEPVNLTHRTAGATYLLCDSTIPGAGGGLLGDATLAWLDEAIRAEASQRPIVLVLHHPPTIVWGGPEDGIHLANADRLEALLRRKPGVSAILAGHYHVALSGVFAGVPLRVAPGVGFAGRMDWERSGERFDPDADPMISFHEIANGQVTTVVRAVAMR